jgi:excinuclease ABC subunit A
MTSPLLILKNVYVHNLKGVNLKLLPNQFIVFTGVSGSGKSSLAFDTIFNEGQRRYIESLPSSARRQLTPLPKPEASSITGISPTIAIEQKMGGKNPRSTVGTMTQIYDFLRVLFARASEPFCPISGEKLTPLSEDKICHAIMNNFLNKRLLILTAFAKGKKGEFKEELADLLKKGFLRVRIDLELYHLSDAIPELDKNTLHDIDIVIDRIKVDPLEKNRLLETIKQALEIGKGMMSVFNIDDNIETFYSQFAYSQKSNEFYPPLEPEDFSFNHPKGMCESCHGLGISREFDLLKVLNTNLSIKEDCCEIAGSYQTVKWGNIYDNLARIYHFKIDTPFKDLPKEAQDVFLYGSDKKWIKMNFVHPTKKTRWTDYVSWKGVLFEAKKRLSEASSELYKKKVFSLMHQSPCSACNQSRLKPYPSRARIGGFTIDGITHMSIEEASSFFTNLDLTGLEALIAKDLLIEIRSRLVFLDRVGLGYLTLDRTLPSLSGGETQRVRLASQIGSGLVGATYILDEPSIGLHQRDNQKLLTTLKALKEKGNTLIVVEHDEETIASADYIVDIGPGAGIFGGEIVAEGTLKDIQKAKRSLTGDYLSGRKSILIPTKRRTSTQQLILSGASHNNLKNITFHLPFHRFVAITGVSGSGKSSLIHDTLFAILSNKLNKSDLFVGKHQKIEGVDLLDKVIGIDQSPIGRTPRSNPATYIKVFDDIRDLFASLPESKAYGYEAGRFSFNVKEGSCATCHGMGMIKVDMDFLADEWILCQDCKGKRFDEKTLSITYREKNIQEVLEMSVQEAHSFFENIPEIQRKLDFLLQVGLNYLKLGQSSTTLSGGEAQRIKLAKELIRPPKGHTLYILDEPTTGLHFHDISKLIDILQNLVEIGHSVVVIEHNLDLVKTVDWIIDLGPEGGSFGGTIIAEGTPEQIARTKTPTGIYLAKALEAKYHLTPLRTNPLPPYQSISVMGARQNNLKNLDIEIPLHKISVFTGPSGSGKTSLAFDTLYAEGQRRYIESLSSFARQMIKQMQKAQVDDIQGIMAAIAVEQKRHSGNPRSTVGTISEIYDYLRILYARLGIPYCPDTKEKIESIDANYVMNKLLALPEKTKIQILAPISLKKQETIEQIQAKFISEGYLRIRLNGNYYELENKIPYNKKIKNQLELVIDRLTVSKNNDKRIHDAIEIAAKFSNNMVLIGLESEDLKFNLAFAVAKTGVSYPSITYQTFSFNTEEGMCPECLGLGFRYGCHLSEDQEIKKYTPYTLFMRLIKEYYSRESEDYFLSLLKKRSIDPDIPISKLSKENKEWFFYGDQHFRGIHNVFTLYGKYSTGDMRYFVTQLLSKQECTSCQGARLNPLARHVELNKVTIDKAINMPLDELKKFLMDIEKTADLTKTLKEILEETIQRLTFLSEIGLVYLSLNRSAPTLSGGEIARLRLATSLGSQMTGALYVLDEPTTGLHPENNHLLNQALIKLKERGNTLVIVEHDPMTIEIADQIFDFGPSGGSGGGQITAQGTLEEIKKNPNSLTGLYLSGAKRPFLPAKKRILTESLSIKRAKKHNLTSIDIDIPLHGLVCLTGLSGSGKSTLLHHILTPLLETVLKQKKRPPFIQTEEAFLSGYDSLTNLLTLDQSPVGHTIRSDVSTYVDLLTPLRNFYSSLPEAKMRGLSPKNFSYNHRKGMCTKCFGLGHLFIDLQFLPSVKTECPSCKGFRLNPLSLEVKYKGKHLGNLFEMTLEEIKLFLPPIYKIVKIIDTLDSFGLGYLQIGRETASLSGGEASRLRLSKELIKSTKGHTLYLFDEPSNGLHDDDIDRLLPIFHKLVDKGHSVIFIEHNLTMMANADWIIDMGPGGGVLGGNVIGIGNPETIAKLSTPTGQYLKKFFARQKEPSLV